MRTEYIPLLWVNDETPLSAENLNHIEAGIKYNNDLAIENAGYIDEIYKAFVEQLSIVYDDANDVLTFSFGSETGNDATERFHNAITLSLNLASVIARNITHKADITGPLPEIYCANLSKTLASVINENNLGGKIFVFSIQGMKLVGKAHVGQTMRFRFFCLSESTYPIIFEASSVSLTLTLNDIFFTDTYKTYIEKTSNKVTSLSDQSTDTQYPSAKAVFDALALKSDKEGVLPGITVPYPNTPSVKSFLDDNDLWDKPFIFKWYSGIYEGYFTQGNNNTYNAEIKSCKSNERWKISSANVNMYFSSIFVGDTYDDNFEIESHKVTSMSDQSTDAQYPSAKATYDLVTNRSLLVETLGNATQSIAGLLSAEDKSRLDALYALLGSESDSDTVVNTINEVLAIFNQYAEGADLVNALAGKADKVGELPTLQFDNNDNVLSKIEQYGLTKSILFWCNGSIYFGKLSKVSPNILTFNFETVSTNIKEHYSGTIQNATNTKFSDIINNSYKHTDETQDNKVTSMSASSTDTEYPSAKAVFDAIALKANSAGPLPYYEVQTTDVIYDLFNTNSLWDKKIVLKIGVNYYFAYGNIGYSSTSQSARIWNDSFYRQIKNVNLSQKTFGNLLSAQAVYYETRDRIITGGSGGLEAYKLSTERYPSAKVVYDFVVDSTARSALVSTLGEATQSINGLLSAQDKTRLDALYALLGETADVDTIVNTLNEVLSVFNQYPEGVTVANALAAKANSSDVYTSAQIDAMFMNDTTDVDEIMED